MKRFFRTVWYVVTLRCEEADRIRSVARSEELTRAERVGEVVHVGMCRCCWAARRKLAMIERELRLLGDPDAAEQTAGPMPDDVRDRIRRRLEKSR